MLIFPILCGAMMMIITSNPPKPIDILPLEISGYRSDGHDELADSNKLFALIDGGAEVYRSLNVHQVFERRYVKKGSPDILVDVFDMGSSEDAFGAFHHDLREGTSAGIGQESEQQGSNLFFWKGIWYVSVVALRQSPEGPQAVLSIGKAIAQRIQSEGRPPDLIRMLPEKGLVKSQLHYFHDWPLLSRLAFLPGDNLLGLGKDTEGFLARYRLDPVHPSDRDHSALLLIRYPTADRARAAHKSLGNEFCATRFLDRIIAGVLFCHSPEPARQLLDSLTLPKGAEP